MEKKERKTTDIVRISIIAARIFGELDKDLSIEVPVEGEIEGEIDTIPEGEIIKTTFEEHHGWQWSPPPTYSPRTFPAVNKGDLYMLWIEERGEWVGIKYEFRGTNFEGEVYGFEEDIYTSGPFNLNDECTEMILRAYSNPSVPFDNVLLTSPTELEKITHNIN